MNKNSATEHDTTFINPKTVSDIISLLNDMLPASLYALDFTLEYYVDLLQRLSVYGKEEHFNDKKEAIKKAIINYFSQTDQNIDITISFKTFTIHKHLKEPTKSELFDRMVHQNGIILSDIQKRKEEFLPLPFLVSIPNDIFTQIMQSYLNLCETIETARHTTRGQVNAIFNLDERDIVFFIQEKISIRAYTPPKKIPAGIDKRFAGESPESMDEMYKTYFPDGAWGSIETILDDVIADRLNFSEIDNATFSRTFIPVFRSMIEILLLDVVSEEDREKIEGQTGYILRIYFQKILLYTAKNLLQCVENRDRNAENFIKYFTDDIIIDANGNKIQKFAITDKRQQKWNYSSVVSVMMQYKQTKIRIAAQQEAILNAQERVSDTQNEIASEKKHKSEIKGEIDEIETVLSEVDEKIVQLKERISQMPEENKALKKEISTLNDTYTELYKKKKNFAAQLELTKNRITNKVSELAQRNMKASYEQKSLQTILEQTASVKEMYEMVSEALALTLAKR